MNRILLLLENNRNRDLLAEWLGQRYKIVLADQDSWLQVPFDACLIDGRHLLFDPALRLTIQAA